MKLGLFHMILFECFVQKVLCSDGIKGCSLSGPPLTGKQVVISHAGKCENVLENSLLLCGK